MTQELATVEAQPSSLLEVIARAARDPAVDVDKLERLFALQERIIERDAKIAFTEAKIKMRPELPIITERGKIIIRDRADKNKVIQESSYAKFEDLNEILNPIINRHGFDLSFRNGTAEDGKVRVYTILTHTGGHSEDTYFDLPPDGSGSKNSVQAVGSSTSYAKRYGVLAILNITTKGEDDDGKKGGDPPTIDEAQYATLVTLAENVGADTKRFLEYMGVDRMLDIKAADYDRAVSALQAKRKAEK